MPPRPARKLKTPILPQRTLARGAERGAGALAAEGDGALKKAIFSVQPGGPPGGLAHVGKFGGDTGADGNVESDVLVEDAKRVFAHFRAAEEFGQFLREIQTKLEGLGRDCDADVVVAKEEPPVTAGDGAARVQKPGL